MNLRLKVLLIYQGSEKTNNTFSKKKEDQYIWNDHQIKNSFIDATSE